MSKWLRAASTLLDSVDSIAKGQLVEEQESAAERRRQKRRERGLQSAGGDGYDTDNTEATNTHVEEFPGREQQYDRDPPARSVGRPFAQPSPASMATAAAEVRPFSSNVEALDPPGGGSPSNAGTPGVGALVYPPPSPTSSADLNQAQAHYLSQESAPAAPGSSRGRINASILHPLPSTPAAGSTVQTARDDTTLRQEPANSTGADFASVSKVSSQSGVLSEGHAHRAPQPAGEPSVPRLPEAGAQAQPPTGRTDAVASSPSNEKSQTAPSSSRGSGTPGDGAPSGDGRPRRGLGSLLGKVASNAQIEEAGRPEGTDPKTWRSEVKALKREVEELSLELEELEDRLAGREAELKSSAEALARAQQLGADREAQLHAEMEDVRALREQEKRALARQLEAKDRAVQDAQQQMEDARQEAQGHRAAAGLLRREMAGLAEEREQLLRELNAARSNQDRSAEELRHALALAEAEAEELKAQHARWMRQAQRRQTELEDSVSSLTRSLAEQQRDVEQRVRAMHGLDGKDEHASDVEVQMLQEELQGCHAALDMERQHVNSLQREVRALQQELASARATAEEDRLRLQRQVFELTTQHTQQRKALEAVEARQAQGGNLAFPAGNQGEEFEARLRAMTEQLLKKQLQLDQASCERATLAARLKAAVQRAEGAEQQLAEIRSNDLEDGVVAGPRDAPGSRHRHGVGVSTAVANHRAINRLAPIARHKQMAVAVGYIDRLTLSTGLYLRNVPAARLLFLMYLALLHLWAFFVLAFHSHNIEEMHADTGHKMAGMP